MQVAVTYVPVRNEPSIRDVVANPGSRFLDESGQRSDWKRDVVLQARTVDALGFGNGFPQLPERFALAITLCDDGIEYEVGFERCGKRLCQQIIELVGS